MKQLFFICIMISLICAVGSAQEAQHDTVLKLTAFIQLVCKHSTFEEILIEELSLKYNNILSTPQIRVLLNTDAHYTLALDPNRDSYPAASIALSGLFPASGTTLSAEYDTGRSPSMTGSSPNSSISLKVEQSVLNNAFGSTNRLLAIMAGYETTLATYQILEAYEEYLAQLLNIYIDWYAAYENLKYAQKSLQDSTTLLNLTKRKRQYNIALPIDVNKSTLQVLSNEEQLLKARRIYESLRKRAAMLSGMAPEEFTYIPGDITLSLDEINMEEKNNHFLSNSRTVRMLELLTTISKHELDLALDDLLPTATVYAAYTLSGDEYLPLENQANDIELGFSFSMPLLNTEAKAKVKIQKNVLEKSLLSQTNQKQELNLQLNVLHDSIAFFKKQLNLAEQKLNTARLIVREEEIQYNQGRSGLDDVLNAYETLDTINQSRLTAIIELIKSYIEWLQFTDTLINENKQIILEKDIKQE